MAAVDGVRRALLMAAATLPQLSSAAETPCYVVVSLIGDRLEFITAEKTTGSRLDRNAREMLEDNSGAFDRLAVQRIGEVVGSVDASARVYLVPMPPSRLHDQPELLLRSDGVVLPNAVVDVIEKERATHVLLLTKHAADARLDLAQNTVGVGKLRGLGFYVDGDRRLRSVESTDQRGRGFIAPFVYLKLSLVDARTARVVRDRDMRASMVVATYNNPDALVPWDALSNEQKILALQRMLEEQLTAATRDVLAR